MGEKTVQGMLVSYIRDAHAMEENVLRMLDGMIATTKDEEISSVLKKHRSETERHAELLTHRLEALGEKTGTAVKDIPAIFGAMMKGVTDAVRSDKAGKNARDGYVTEAMEIAAYRLLEQLAQRAGDLETAMIARNICKDEEAMRDLIDAKWGKFMDLTLEEEGVTTQAS
jgi:ferritin-like metal-binding protein YciE